MDESIYGPVDDDVYRSIAKFQKSQRYARYLYDLTLVAVNYGQRPDQLDHLIHKWMLTDSELASAQGFIRDFQVSQ